MLNQVQHDEERETEVGKGLPSMNQLLLFTKIDNHFLSSIRLQSRHDQDGGLDCRPSRYGRRDCGGRHREGGGDAESVMIFRFEPS
jgi:hypothetical protein